jgi:cytosine/adenosine deaminase-related metal-dependent hydrolase
MAASTFFLFINGTVLLYVQDDQVSVKRLDILIREGIIVDIDSNIPEPRDNDIEVIDCSNLIISPGLVDTHRHLWQTQLKGRHSDELLLDYIPSGNLTGFFYKPEDVKFGELSGAMESINVGTTTIVDHMHVAYSADHHNAAMMALEASGARVVFCPSPTMRVKEWSPKMLMEEEVMPSWFLPTVQDLANRQASRDGGRVSVGLGFDSYASLPEEDVVKVFAQAKLWNFQLITSHHTHGQICKSI